MCKDTKVVECALTKTRIDLIIIEFVLGIVAISLFAIYIASNYANQQNTLYAYMNAFDNATYSIYYA